ncbi:MAG: carboxypeptidase-like regulatory domain-containing protein, partial [Gammaproteobacteria bacterium]|nr:carboxypeptidase-like regulatory domain-containing protein [Gammaproteobacteria bacterium]
MQERICQSVGGSARGLGLLAISIVLFVVSGLGASTNAKAETTWHDISASVSIEHSNPLRNRRSPDAQISIEITNISGAALAAPLRLVIGGFAEENQFATGEVSLQGATGTNADGAPYLDLAPYIGNELAAGASSGSITLTILGGGRSLFNFFPRVEQEQTVGDEPLTVQITHPATLLTVGVSPVTIEGTISSPDAVLTVNGATVAQANGQFSVAVSLEEGLNNIVVRAVQSGEETTDSIVVSLDATPPYVTIDAPTDGGVVYTSVISVSGLVNDIVRGTISEGEANVTVNGVAATVSNRSYLAQNIPLNEGDNTLMVTASDQVGNVGSATITVRYDIPRPKRIERVSGQDQQARIHTVLAESLVVKLLGSDGSPVVDQGVVFRVTQGNGLLAAGTADEAQGVLVKTDANGLAQTTFRLGSRAGQATHRVRARAVGYDGEAVFHASATTNLGDKIGVIAGNNQRGAISQPLPNPLIVAVTDDGANLVANATVEFTVTKGGGSFQNGETTYTTQTDSDGRAIVEFNLGDEAGLDVQRVMATLVGTEASAGFTASGLIIGDPGQTRITGVVLDNQDTPVPGVTVRVEGTTREAITDEQGQFEISEVPVGPVHLLADGSTATVGGEWPTLSYNIVTIAGAENPLSAPIYMVKLDTENAVTVGDEDVVYTLPDMPGFKLTVKAGSVTFPDGSKSGQISVTAVNANKIPMPPPNGMQPQFIVTIQPAGAKFDPPAPLSIPNVDGHLPGAQVEMYSYDHDLEEFVAIGLGTVSKDGSIIETNPGVGVIKAGWHCGSQPGGSGCCDGGGG